MRSEKNTNENPRKTADCHHVVTLAVRTASLPYLPPLQLACKQLQSVTIHMNDMTIARKIKNSPQKWLRPAHGGVEISTQSKTHRGCSSFETLWPLPFWPQRLLSLEGNTCKDSDCMKMVLSASARLLLRCRSVILKPHQQIERDHEPE